jgi:molybdopterin converting factor small subunit
MNVLIPTPLLSYTHQVSVQASGATIAEVLTDLDTQFPGIRFRMIDEQDRIRRHVRLFVRGRQVESLDDPLEPDDELVIVQALSGG